VDTPHPVHSVHTHILCLLLVYVLAHCSAIDRLRHLTSFPVIWDGKSITTHAWCGVVEGLPVYLLEAEKPSAFFWRGQFYGEVRIVHSDRCICTALSHCRSNA
jgi:hypothetical protein